MSLSSKLSIKKNKIECPIRNKFSKLIVLKFWIRAIVNPLCEID